MINFSKLKKQMAGDGGDAGQGDAPEGISASKHLMPDKVMPVSKHSLRVLHKEVQPYSEARPRNAHTERKLPSKTSIQEKGGWLYPLMPDEVCREDGLIETRYCYGCAQFSVDQPFCEDEVGWCVRQNGENGGGGYSMKRIFSKHRVEQCPLFKAGERGLRKM